MKRLPLALALLAGCWLAAASGSLAKAASTLCVGGPGCYSTLQAAVDAAHDGDTITIAPGSYAGGVTIDVSVRLVGAGAGQTTISGGGPVLTIGAYGASSEPTVSIDGVTITGGVTRSSPESVPFVGQEGVIALGGGIEIPPNADFSGGADVTITNSVITGNRVAPTATLPIGPTCPSGRPCPFAWAIGGGIDNWGTLTLDGTTVSNNRVGTASGLSNLASDADSGAIQNWLNTPLTITNSVISGNQASASAPNGRFADSGAIFMEGGSLSMSGSSVTNNSATLNAGLPNSVNTLAVAGGIHISDQASGGSIRNTTVSGNAVTMTNTAGDANAFTGAFQNDSNTGLELSNDVITNNSVTVSALGHSGGNAAGDSGAGEWGGTVTNTRVTGNRVSTSSVAGDADADAGASEFNGSITNSLVSDNHVQAYSPHGTAIDRGGGLVGGRITLRNTTVSGNTANANGRSGFARGGGIFGDAPLVLVDSSVTGNALSGNSAITLQGGGIYATASVSLTNSVIADNIPDQCFGC
jgi:predicted outer membrane repeat protein